MIGIEVSPVIIKVNVLNTYRCERCGIKMGIQKDYCRKCRRYTYRYPDQRKLVGGFHGK